MKAFGYRGRIYSGFSFRQVRENDGYGRVSAVGTWHTILTIYYANSLSWRLLKAGGLFFLGCFVWAGSNILASCFSELTLLEYTTSYGFVLIGYGPVHHIAVIPLYQRLRKQGIHLTPGGHAHLPNLSLIVFTVLVLSLAVNPLPVMVIDFQSTFDAGGGDVTTELACVKHTDANDTVGIHCHLTDETGIAQIDVQSGSTHLLTDDTPPFEFSISSTDLESTMGTKRFRVELTDTDGTLIRRFTRTLPMIEEG